MTYARQASKDLPAQAERRAGHSAYAFTDVHDRRVRELRALPEPIRLTLFAPPDEVSAVLRSRPEPAASITTAHSCPPPGGVLVGTSDGACAPLLQAEGSVLINVRTAAASTLGTLAGAVHRSQPVTWRSALAASASRWALLYGGTDTACRRFVRLLPGGRPALRVELPAPEQRSLARLRRGIR